MKDIDFDELDKAVSAVLKPRAKKSAISEIPPRQKLVQTGRDDTQVSQNDTNTPHISVHKNRRSGSFMDMVHPSSRMAGAKNASPVVGLKRPAPAIVAPESPTPSTVVEEKSLDEKPEVSNEKTDDNQSSFTDNSFSETLKPVATMKLGEPPAVGQNTAPIKQSSPTPEPSPLPSFIEGAKVEKRPLGALTSSDFEKDDTQLPAITTINTVSKPPEFEEDVLAVESDVLNPETRPSVSNQPPPVSPPVTSIAQQYTVKSENQQADASEHQLFDVQEYHPPLDAKTQTHHHRHLGIWVALAVILLLLTAAGFGYWIYQGL